MAGILDGIRVLDFGRYIAGPYCAALLGDLGADVIRVEKRDGSEDRWLQSILPGPKETPREGSLFLQMNRNKRGLTLDPMSAKGREVARRLIATADVVVANLPAETLTAMGLDWEAVSAVNPRVVLATVSAFGNGGPYSHRVGFDGVAQTMSGSAWLTGDPASRPGRPSHGSISAPPRSRPSASWRRFSTARRQVAADRSKARSSRPRSPSSVPC